MAVRVELETDIARPPADVFDALTDLESWPAWLIASGVTGVVRTDGGALRVGSRLRLRQQLAGRASELDGEVAVLEPPTAFGLHARDRDGVTVEIEATLASNAATTRLRWSVTLGLPFRYRVFEGMVAPQAQRAAALDLEGFRRRLERAADGGSATGAGESGGAGGASVT